MFLEIIALYSLWLKRKNDSMVFKVGIIVESYTFAQTNQFPSSQHLFQREISAYDDVTISSHVSLQQCGFHGYDYSKGLVILTCIRKLIIQSPLGLYSKGTHCAIVTRPIVIDSWSQKCLTTPWFFGPDKVERDVLWVQAVSMFRHDCT